MDFFNDNMAPLVYLKETTVKCVKIWTKGAGYCYLLSHVIK